jgi:TonB family protein
MRILNRLPQKMVCLLVLLIACSISTHPLPQGDQSKDNTPPKEKKPEEKILGTTSQRDSIEILSDTLGVDFGPYFKRLRYKVQAYWNANTPPVALPPVLKSGTVTIELAILKNGQVRDMKVVKSSGDTELDKAAWSAIAGAVPLPTLPSEFKGDYLRLRCNFTYNPPAKPAQEATPGPQK